MARGAERVRIFSVRDEPAALTSDTINEQWSLHFRLSRSVDRLYEPGEKCALGRNSVTTNVARLTAKAKIFLGR